MTDWSVFELLTASDQTSVLQCTIESDEVDLLLKFSMMTILILLACLIATAHGQQSLDAYQMLEMAALQVFKTHAAEMTSPIPPPPDFELPGNMMRSFVPDTGIANREELFIDSVRNIPVFTDASFSNWRYQRFNNTDYILGFSPKNVALNKMAPSNEDFLAFSNEEGVFSFVPDYWSTVTDAILFTRFIRRTAVMYIAVLTQNSRSSGINVYEVVGDRSLPATFIQLNMNLYAHQYTLKKMAYIQSQYGESLVVLVDSPGIARINYQQQGSNDLNHYIEIYYPNAVDMVTFTIHGHGYIAVSNDTTCEVYKLDQFSRSHLLFDRLTFSSVVDLEYFRLGFHHYLAVSGQDQQTLFTWKIGEFSLKQRFQDTDVLALHPLVLQTCRDEVILVSIQERGVEIYVYNGKQEAFQKAVADTPPGFNIVPGSIASFTHKNRAVLLYLNSDNEILASVLLTRLEAAENPIRAAGKNVTERMLQLQNTLDAQTDQINTIQQVLSNAVRSSGDQTITAFQTFGQLHSTKGATVNVVRDPVIIEWEGSSLSLEEYRQGTEFLQAKITELEAKVAELERSLPDVVRTDESAIITGRKNFQAAVSGSSLSASSVFIQSAANIDIPELQNSLYRLDRPQKIAGTITFEAPLTILGNLDVEKTVNGIDIDKEIMTTNTDQTSYASMTFTNTLEVRGDIQMSGKLNGIDVSEDVVTLAGTHHISGKKTFSDGIHANDVTTQLLDGVNVEDVYQRAMFKSTVQDVTGTKTFNGGVVTGNIELSGLLNGYDVKKLAESIVRVDTPAYIAGNKTFTEDVTATSDLTIDGTINDLHIPEDLFFTDLVQTVTGEKEFLGTVTATEVYVNGTVDGLRFPDDVVTLSGDEEIPSTLYFTSGINVEGDIVVEGLVDGVDISEVVKEALKLNETNKIETAVFVGPVKITGDLTVKDTVNGVDLKSLVDDIVLKNQPNIVIESQKKFKKVTADTVKVSKINGYDLANDFMTVSGNQNIKGTKIFKKPVYFNNIQILDNMIGGVNIADLSSKTPPVPVGDQNDQPQNDLEFIDEIIVDGDLVVSGLIEGLRVPEDFVLKNKVNDRSPISNKFFNSITVDNLVVDGNAKVSGLFAGKNLQKFKDSRLTLTTDQTIQGDIWIGNTTIDTLKIDGLVNGFDFDDFKNNIMSKTKDQVVTASKSFNGIVTFNGPVTTEAGINDVNVAFLHNSAFKLKGDNHIAVPMEFGDITVGDLQVTGLVNGVNLTEFVQDALKKKDDYQVLTGVNVFQKGFHVNGDISTETVNDLNIPTDVLLKNTPQTITGKYTFDNVVVYGDVQVDGLVNGLDLSETAPQMAKSDHETIIESNVHFTGPIQVNHDIEVTGLVNGMDFRKISDDVVTKENDQYITGHKVLRGPVTVNGNLNVEYVNGIKWYDFLADVVRIDQTRRVDAPKTFAQDVEVDEIYAGEAEVGLVNGMNLQDFINDAVFVDIPANITGLKVFQNPVEISGDFSVDLLNELRLKSDVITLTCNEDGPQVITGQKTFGDLTVYGDIHVRGSVNSYDLKELYSDTLLIEGNQNITGTKIIQNKVTFKENIYPTTVNGLVLRRDLVTLAGDQTLNGALTFADSLMVEGNLQVEGYINGIDVREMAADAIYLDTDGPIDGTFIFENAVINGNLMVDGTVNGIDLPMFDRNVTDFWQNVGGKLLELQRRTGEQCDQVKYLQDVLSNSYYVLDGFTVYQEINYPSSYVVATSNYEMQLVYFDNEPYPVSVPLSWDYQSEYFQLYESERTRIVRTISADFYLSSIVINIGANEEDSLIVVNKSPPPIIPSGFKDAAILVGEKEVVVALLFPVRGVAEIYRIKDSTIDYVQGLEKADVESLGVADVGEDVTSMAVFEITDSTNQKSIYLAVSRLYAPPYVQGFCRIYSRYDNVWKQVQSISVVASTQVKHFHYHNYHYLAFTSVAPMHETKEPKSIQIYRNSGSNGLFSLFQKIPFDDAKGLETFTFGDISELYLTTWNKTKIGIYRLEGESGFHAAYTLNGFCINDVKVLSIDVGEIYLVAGQQNLQSNDKPLSSIIYKGLTKGTRYIPHRLENC